MKINEQSDRLNLVIDYDVFESAKINQVDIPELIRDHILNEPIYHGDNRKRMARVNVTIPTSVKNEIKNRNINVSQTLEKLLSEYDLVEYSGLK